MKNFFSNLIADMKESVKTRPTLFTVAAVAVILIVGFTAVTDPRKTPIAAGISLGLVFAVWVASLRKSVFSGIASVLILAFMMTAANTMGGLVPVQLFAIYWPMALLSVFLVMLAVSYWVFFPRGRWLPLTLANIAGFATTYALVAVGFDGLIGLAISVAVSLLVFGAFLFGSRRASNKDGLPEARKVDSKLLKNLQLGAAAHGMSVRAVAGGRGYGAHFILYGGDDGRAYILYPVELIQAFGLVGKRSTQLSYSGVKIAPWLTRLVYQTAPNGARGAAPAFALLDVNRKNGPTPRAIEVASPGARKTVVGVIPGSNAKDPDIGWAKTVGQLVETMSPFGRELSSKQIAAVAKIGYHEIAGAEGAN